MTIQEFIWPQKNFCDISKMYYRSKNDSYRIEGKTLILQKGSEISFDTYFNSFSVGRWLKYTKIPNLSLSFLCNGKVSVRFFKGKGKKYEAKLKEVYRTFPNQTDIAAFSKEINKCLSYDITAIESDCTITGDEYEISITLKDFSENEIIYPIILAEENCEIKNLCWNTVANEDKLRDVKLAAGICTYKREDFIKRNVSALKDKVIENKDSPLYENLEIYIADNGQTLPQNLFESNKIHIFPNKNLGGSAGFTRTMIEALINDKEKGFTHIVLMDDDILLPISTLERMYVFLRLVKDEYKNSLLGATMLTLQEKSVQVECGATFDGSRHYRKNNHYFDLSDFSAVCTNNLPASINYSGWWCCCCVLEKGLPMPFFIHLDDIEYGIRNTNNGIIMLNGISVWHPAFIGKGATFYSYYDVRNLLITECITGIQTKNPVEALSYESFFEALMFNPREFDLKLMAMKDFLKGAEHFINQDALELQGTISKIKPETIELSSLKGRISSKQKLFKKQRIARALHILLLFLPSKNEIKLIDKRSICDYPFTSRYIFMLNEDRKTGYLVEWRKLFLRKLVTALVLRSKVRRYFPKLKAEWQNAKKTVTSLEFWKKYLGI